MSRQLLDESSIHPDIRSRISDNYEETVIEVKKAAESHDVLVVGMAQNPFCKKVRKHLDEANISFQYLEYGSYFKEWHRRLALKMWSGWSTFPMVFVKGQLVGGNKDVEILLASGALQTLMNGSDQ